MTILDIIYRSILLQRRGLTNPTFRTLEYMQYIDYGLQLEPYCSEILIRNGFDLDCF